MVERAAAESLEEAGNLIREIDGEPDLSAFEEEFGDARTSYAEARDLYSEELHEEALRSSRRSVALLSSILSALRDQGAEGEAHVISFEGRVEFKRGEYADWEVARPRQSLRKGFLVRTANNASAEIMFGDGTLYNVRPNTLFVVSGGRGGASSASQSILRYGWVDLSTSKRGSRVETPEAQAEVRQDSSGSVTYDGSASAGRFATYRGQMKVEAASGKVQEVGALQEVTQSRGELSEPKPIPRAPELLAPLDNLEQSENDQELQLAWKSVEGAARYEVQVSRTQLFADNIIATDDRKGTSAKLGVRAPGSFLWRVAAIDAQGRRGPWSEIRRFRIAAEGSGQSTGERDSEPPALALNAPQAYGSIFIISGVTEPGATVTVRSEPVTVGADGSFAKTLQVYDNGWSIVDVRAKDAYGNETSRPIRLYVDNL